MQTLKTTESKKFGQFTITPKISGTTVFFNLDRRGGSARYSLTEGKFLPVRGDVGNLAKSWIKEQYINE